MSFLSIVTSFVSSLIASAGSAQNGWIMLVQASPQSTAIETRARSAPRSVAAALMFHHTVLRPAEICLWCVLTDLY